jgi:hypothetical protein
VCRCRQSCLDKWEALLIALTKCVRVLPIDAHGEISDLHQSCRVTSKSWRLADTSNVIHVRLTASGCEQVEHLADQRIHAH